MAQEEQVRQATILVQFTARDQQEAIRKPDSMATELKKRADVVKVIVSTVDIL